MTESRSCIAYLDPLGSLDLARHDVNGFAHALAQFQEVTRESQSELGKDDRIVLLHDRAYIGAKDPRRLFRYVRRVRKELLIQGYYIRGAIAPGTLAPTPIKDDHVEGIVLATSDATTVYGLQEDVKGIGIFVDPKLVSASGLEDEVVLTCYLHNARGSARSFTVVPFYDVSLGDNERTQKVLQRLQQNLYRIWTRSSQRVSRYFITLLITWVRSENYSSLTATGPDVDRKENKYSKKKPPNAAREGGQGVRKDDLKKAYTFDPASLNPISRIIVRRDIDNYRGVPGIELVSLAFVDEVIRQATADIVSNAAVAFLAQQKQLLRNLGLIDEAVISRTTRETIAKFLATHMDTAEADQTRSPGALA